MRLEAASAGPARTGQPQGGQAPQREPGREQGASDHDLGEIPPLLILLTKLLLQIRHM